MRTVEWSVCALCAVLIGNWSGEKTMAAEEKDRVVALDGAVQPEGRIVIERDGMELLHYQVEPLSKPMGGEAFKGSDFIHPLRTPGGFILTGSQPKDHLHHFGLWWPWKYLKVEGRKILCWELQKGEGLIRTRRLVEQASDAAGSRFSSESDYIDRTAPGGPKVVLHETLAANVSAFVDSPARGYFLDLEIAHRCAAEEPVEVVPNLYSGFTLRGTDFWNKHNSTVLTSGGKGRDDSNKTRARWVRVEGDAGGGKTSGVVMMSRDDNRNHPEHLRTWDSRQQDGAIFVNFNPVQENPWVFEPGREYTRNYRLFVYDGSVSPEQAEEMWGEYVTRKPAGAGSVE